MPLRTLILLSGVFGAGRQPALCDDITDAYWLRWRCAQEREKLGKMRRQLIMSQSPGPLLAGGVVLMSTVLFVKSE